VGLALSLTKQIAALVHPEAFNRAAERARHEAFISRQLLASLAIMAAAPLFLACYGAPAPWHAAVFAWGILPLCAVALVSRTGELALAQGLSMTCFIGVAITLAIGGGNAWQATLAWLVLVPLEGVLTQNRRLVLLGATAAIASLLALATAAASGWFDLVSSLSYLCMLIAPAVLYAALLAITTLRQQQDHHRTIEILNLRRHVLYETMGDLVIHHDATGLVEHVSNNCEILFGLPARSFMGRGLFERIHVADRPALLKCLSDATRSPTTVCAMLRLRTGLTAANTLNRSEPVFRWIELRAHAHQIPGQQNGCGAVEVLSILRDVTDGKMQSEDLNAARTALEEHGVWKDQFIANVSHELRTPLNAIIGFAEMLANPQLVPQLPERRQEYAEIIHQSGQHLLSVVNSILDVSKIQSGTFDIMPEAFDMAPLIDLCCDMVKLKAQESKIELVRSYPHGLEEIVGDKRACKQILINLLSNAVKFTPPYGRVTIDVQPDGNHFSISVADTGIGIAARDLSRLGDPFFQAGASYDRPYEGTGLGLSVVRGLVGLHGGTMSIESELGKGTRVTVRLPLDCRQIAGAKSKSAKIETISRRTRVEDVEHLNHDVMVKKIA
jgi:two-component system, cell cycle sensor histidine kinase DivJ